MDKLLSGTMNAHDGGKYLPQYTLDALYMEVIEPLNTFNGLDSETIWDTASGSCRRIEQDLRLIDSIIAEAKRELAGTLPGRTICHYHQMLARIYILLYYVHRDDKVYQEVIFPKLLRDMGPYGLPDFTKAHITRKIDDLLEQDRVLAKAMQKQPVGPLPVVQDSVRSQDMKPTLTASEAALLIMTVVHEIGGLPKDKKMLYPILTQCWGFTEQTASRALGAKLDQETAKHLAQVFEDVSPKLARLIREFPDKFEKLKLAKLKANNDKKVKKT